MQTEKEIIGDTITVVATGRIDTMTAADFSTQVKDALDNNDVKNLILDFAGINYISSVGLRVILEFQKKMNERGSMKLINVQPEVMEVFEMTGFKNILTIE